MSAPKGPAYFRTEDGATFNPGASQYQTAVWERVRLESGEDVLVGPANLEPTQTVTARLSPGDVGIVQTGTTS